MTPEAAIHTAMPSAATIPTISSAVLGFFRSVVRRYFRREFHAVRINGADRVRHLTGPVIVYANHSSWWDPMICFLLGAELMPERRHFAPMDAAALDRYRILKRIGVFPVDLASPRGAVQFLRTGEAALRSPGGTVWITPQGRFADARERPLVFKPGLAALAGRLEECAVVPLAIEYTFWNERKPEVLMQIGEPEIVHHGETEDLESRLQRALESAMEQLRTSALQRDPVAFDRVLVHGSAGTGGFYAFGQRVRALMTRQRYQAEHTVTAPRAKMGADGGSAPGKERTQ